MDLSALDAHDPLSTHCFFCAPAKPGDSPQTPSAGKTD